MRKRGIAASVVCVLVAFATGGVLGWQLAKQHLEDESKARQDAELFATMLRSLMEETYENEDARKEFLRRWGNQVWKTVPYLLERMKQYSSAEGSAPEFLFVNPLYKAVDFPIGSEAKELVPLLAAAVNHDDSARENGAMDVREAAAYLLGRLGEDAVEAVPALLQALKHPNRHTRLHAAQALAQVQPENKAAIPVLREALRDQVSTGWVIPEAVLTFLGDETAIVSPALVEHLDRYASGGWHSTRNEIITVAALWHLGAEAKSAVPVLLEYMDNRELIQAKRERDVTKRVLSHAAILKIDPTNEQARSSLTRDIPWLSKLIGDNPYPFLPLAGQRLPLIAIDALARLAPKEAAAYDALRDATRLPDPAIQKAAYTYGTTMPPMNFRTDNQVACPTDPQHSWQNWNHAFAYKSRHPGGANFLFADGSAHFLSQDITHNPTYHYLSCRNDGQVIAKHEVY